MECFNSVTTNAGGVPYLSVSNVTVSDTAVDLALGWSRRQLPAIGYLTIRVANQIPADATTTLPITITRNGVTRNLTLPNGDAVTVADLVGVQVMLLFNDRFNNILALMSRTID